MAELTLERLGRRVAARDCYHYHVDVPHRRLWPEIRRLMRSPLVAAFFLLAGTHVLAHRLDEYLEGTIVTIEKGRVQAEMTLTPGVAVFPFLISFIDTDRDGVISESEQRTYAGQVLRDLTLKIDGHRLTPELISTRFPAIEEMKEGRGEIQLDFRADLPGGGRDRKLVLENHHQKQIAAYQVNCLVPRDPHIRVLAQNRNYLQSVYELDYQQTDVPAAAGFSAWLASGRGWVAAIVLLLVARLAWMRKRRVLAIGHCDGESEQALDPRHNT